MVQESNARVSSPRQNSVEADEQQSTTLSKLHKTTSRVRGRSVADKLVAKSKPNAVSSKSASRTASVPSKVQINRSVSRKSKLKQNSQQVQSDSPWHRPAQPSKSAADLNMMNAELYGFDDSSSE